MLGAVVGLGSLADGRVVCGSIAFQCNHLPLEAPDSFIEMVK